MRHYNKIYDYFHKTSRSIVNYCREQGIGAIIIGYNEKWKSGKKLSRRFRKDFYRIPFYTLLKMIKYKAELVGIESIKTEESDTSQTCAFRGTIDGASRVERGLYVCKHCKRSIHSDINGAIYIVKRVAPRTFNKILKTDPKK